MLLGPVRENMARRCVSLVAGGVHVFVILCQQNLHVLQLVLWLQTVFCAAQGRAVHREGGPDAAWEVDQQHGPSSSYHSYSTYCISTTYAEEIQTIKPDLHAFIKRFKLLASLNYTPRSSDPVTGTDPRLLIAGPF